MCAALFACLWQPGVPRAYAWLFPPWQKTGGGTNQTVRNLVSPGICSSLTLLPSPAPAIAVSVSLLGCVSL